MAGSGRSRMLAAGCAAIGAIAPDILIIYSKRWAVPPLELPGWQYLAATLLYIGVAVVLGAIYPYRPQPSAWKGFGIGVGTPVILSALVSVVKPASLAPRGLEVPPDWWDLLALW